MTLRPTEVVVILDFGSQYSQLIARRVRELNVYCELLPHHTAQDTLATLKPRGYILSGGPASVYDADAPRMPDFVLNSDTPILGICYGMQLLCHQMGGRVAPSQRREYGLADVALTQPETPLFQRLAAGLDRFAVWMSHGDKVEALPPGFQGLAASPNSPYAVVGNLARRMYGLQFHPEVTHTQNGASLLEAFLYDICGCSGGWTIRNFIEDSLADLRTTLGEAQVICGLSGGVDSSVTAALLDKAVGDQLTCIFVNNGLMRQGEPTEVVQTFEQEMQARLVAVDGTERFLDELAGVTDPEAKRKIIGATFIRLFEAEARKLGDVQFLAQGTLYPDVIESAVADQKKTGAATIKTHHNVGGLPPDLSFALVEPLRYLFKDEVRAVGEALGLPREMVWRHPFPGPGLAVRILGEITWERLEMLRQADAIFIEELHASDWYYKTSQAFAVFLPVKSVGVMGDYRTYGNVIALRAVTTDDFMTADWAKLPPDLLARVSNRIVNEVDGVNRVTYDISSKPPATIEWE